MFPFKLKFGQHHTLLNSQAKPLVQHRYSTDCERLFISRRVFWKAYFNKILRVQSHVFVHNSIVNIQSSAPVRGQNYAAIPKNIPYQTKQNKLLAEFYWWYWMVWYLWITCISLCQIRVQGSRLQVKTNLSFFQSLNIIKQVEYCNINWMCLDFG